MLGGGGRWSLNRGRRYAFVMQTDGPGTVIVLPCGADGNVGLQICPHWNDDEAPREFCDHCDGVLMLTPAQAVSVMDSIREAMRSGDVST